MWRARVLLPVALLVVVAAPPVQGASDLLPVGVLAPGSPVLSVLTRCGALLGQAVLIAPPPVAAPEGSLAVPEYAGWVTDLAGLLSPEQARDLAALAESYKGGASHDLAVLCMPSLEGDSLEGFALRVAREWGLGSTETSDGALLLVVSDSHQIRIEVGRGLEGALPDVICARIIRDVIAPRFKAGDFAGGLRAGMLAMHAAIGGDYAPIEQARRRRGAPGVGLLVMFLLFMILGGLGGRRHWRGGLSPLGWIFLGSAFGRRGGGFGGGGLGGGGGGFGGGGFGGFGGGGGFSGGGASGGW